MAYRISLHVLATLWHLMLMVLSINMRKTHRYYGAFVPVCLFSALFTFSWAVGLIYQSEWAMRFTWIGFFWSTYYYFYICHVFNIELTVFQRRMMWGLSFFIVIGGMSPFGLVGITAFDPEVVADYGRLEPVLRLASLVQLLLIIWTLVRAFMTPPKEGHDKVWLSRVGIFGFLIYGIGAAFTCSLLPFFGEYRFIESTSYGSVVWTTYAFWIVFRELQAQNKTLHELDIFKKTLINHVTHEFRTPIGAIISAVDVLQARPTDQASSNNEYLRMIESNAQRLNHFANELLDLAAIQQARVKLSKSTVDIKEVVQHVLNDVRSLAEQNKVTLEFTGPSIMCECDDEKIQQVVSNLVSNAIKAAPQGRVHIVVEELDASIKVHVHDNGVGISADHIPHVFESFYQVRLKQPTRKGSGLGLAIAKGWIEAHGGTIGVESAGEGQGSRFWFTIPK